MNAAACNHLLISCRAYDQSSGSIVIQEASSITIRIPNGEIAQSAAE